MDSICVVKFTEHSKNQVCFVPEAHLQSSKNVKTKINGEYLFIHKEHRHQRGRGKLLFRGTLAECEEYCQGDGTLRVDDSTWIIGAAQTNESASDKTTKSSAPQRKKRNGSIRGKQHGKRTKASSTQEESVLIRTSTDQNDQCNRGTNPRTTNSIDHSRSRHDQNEEISIVRCDVTGKDNSNNLSMPSAGVPFNSTNAVNTSVSSNNAKQPTLTNRQQTFDDDSNQALNFTPRRTISSADTSTVLSSTNVLPNLAAIEGTRSGESIRNDDEDVLPRHIQIELTRNRKRIIELEDQVKELKKLSIPMPTAVESDYLRRLLAVVDMRSEMANIRGNSFGQKLGLTDVQLLEASGNGKLSWRKIVVNLIVICYKDVNLENESYISLRNRNRELMDNISAYVRMICPSATITDTQFSACVSGKCHHLKSDRKRKEQRLNSSALLEGEAFD